MLVLMISIFPLGGAFNVPYSPPQVIYVTYIKFITAFSTQQPPSKKIFGLELDSGGQRCLTLLRISSSLRRAGSAGPPEAQPDGGDHQHRGGIPNLNQHGVHTAHTHRVGLNPAGNGESQGSANPVARQGSENVLHLPHARAVAAALLGGKGATHPIDKKGGW